MNFTRFWNYFFIKNQFLILIIWFSLLSGLRTNYWKGQGLLHKRFQDSESIYDGLRVV
jgi:hypothetical protein